MINLAEHNSVYYTERCTVCHIKSFYKIILTYDEYYVTYLLCIMYM